MIGIIEAIFIIIVFSLIWFLILKFKLILDDKKKLNGIVEKIEKQNKRFFIEGKELDLKKIIGFDEKIKDKSSINEDIKTEKLENKAEKDKFNKNE